MSNTEKENDAFSRAIISCFTLFFPDQCREKLLHCSSKYLESDKDTSTALIENFAITDPFSTIQSLQSFFLYSEKEPLGLGLYKIFKVLYSKRIKDEKRAALISTFRDLRLKGKEQQSENCIKQLDKYIDDSYNLFCEATSHVGRRTNFKSENICGSLIDPKMPDINADATNVYLKRHIKQIDPEGKLLLCDKIKIDWSEYKLDTEESRRKFIENIYDGLYQYSKEGGKGLLNFPNTIIPVDRTEQDSGSDKFNPMIPKEEIKQDTVSGKYYPTQCTRENFINMFEGITDSPPHRTMLCKHSYNLECFISALQCPQGSRETVAESFRQLIVSPDGNLVKENTLRKQQDRHVDLRTEYGRIINNALTAADGKFPQKS